MDNISRAVLSNYSDIDFYVRKYSISAVTSSLHFHEFLQINYISEGECFHSIGGVEYVVKSGDIFVVPPHVNHVLTKKENYDALVYEIEFAPDFINTALVAGNDSLGITNVFWDLACINPLVAEKSTINSCFSISDEMQERVERMFSDMLREYSLRPVGCEYILSALVLSLLVYLGREYSNEISNADNNSLYATQKQNIVNALEYINTHYMENLSVGEVAKQCYISASYFKSLFKYFTSMTFVEYLNNVRVSKAAVLLRQTDMKVLDIALETGFNYVNHFNRVFKQIMNETPLQYRMKNR